MLPTFGTIPIFWRSQALFWMLLTAFGLVARTLIYDDVKIALVLVLVMEPAAVFLTWLLRNFYRRTSDVRSVSGRTLSGVALTCAAAALVEIALAGLVRILFDWAVPDGRLVRWTVLPFGYYWVVFIGWSLLYFWMSAIIFAGEDRERAMAAEAAAARSELDRLRLQLDPRLIFNALNGIVVEVPERPAVALSMLQDLSDYLRFSLQNTNQPICTVAAEIALVRSFLSIQEGRFGDRLRCTLQVAPEALSRQLPSFVMQLLVENAIKHGLRGGSERLAVDVIVEAVGERIIMQVRNNGHLQPSRAPGTDGGYGLANLTRRLQLQYPGRHRFALGQVHGDVIAQLELEGQPCFG
ncbi:MAG TPA: histidine kinase [Geminicoccus sp.]|uniref:sensor histidine kinase n=1 Tax=Geminicoccus sp. TaxID=2024832 RepID=UPI002E35210B|nr:histidine kinase [Geminicoccus sp.]HEX2528867.1 histidine kinase [Geminicoccus sp.]